MRLRIAVELGVVGALTIAYLCLAPPFFRNNNGVNIGLALVALGLVWLTAKETRERIWGPPDAPAFDRVRRCAISMTLLTVPAVLAFLAWGLYAGGIWRILQLNFLIAL